MSKLSLIPVRVRKREWGYTGAMADGTSRDERLPWPESLCHRCAAPPRYVASARGSVFILCPLLPQKYPPQPVVRCPLFRPRQE